MEDIDTYSWTKSPWILERKTSSERPDRRALPAPDD